MLLIELCSSNEMATHVGELEEAGCDVVSYACLDRCERCVFAAYVYADGKLLEGPSADELVEQLRSLAHQRVQSSADGW
ncbi:MAG: DUF1450 domain-containing protein [Firmicutes bacterium]|nr:DUF1450 domain-containing protein [Bacillota bacterium]